MFVNRSNGCFARALAPRGSSADLGDLYAESGQSLQGSFSAVSKQASKYVQSFLERRRDPGIRAQLKCT